MFSGFYRVIFSAILGLIISILGVLAVRAVLGLDLWNQGIILAVAPFGMLLGWIWSIGGLNLNHYIVSAEEVEETSAIVEAEPIGEAKKAVTIFFDEFGKAAVYAIVIFLAIFVFANMPSGLSLQIANEEAANTATFGNEITLVLPMIGEVVTNQLVIFAFFVGWLLFSLVAFAGVVGFLMVKGHEQVSIARDSEVTAEQLQPPAPVRALGRGAKGLAKSLRKDLPKFLGQK